MGCWRSVPVARLCRDEDEPLHPLPSGVDAANLHQLSPRLPWTKEASKWRWILRTCQSLVASLLYIVGVCLRAAIQPTYLQLLLGLLWVLPFMVLYHWLSMNQSGGYYDTSLDMIVKLPEHLCNLMERGTSVKYRMQIAYEHRKGIVRTVNALESGIIYMFVSSMSLGIAAKLHETCVSRSGELDCPNSMPTKWLVTEWFLFLCIHRIIGANVFEGKYRGLLMPEAMWEFQSMSDWMPGDPCSHVICTSKPLRSHPEPTY